VAARAKPTAKSLYDTDPYTSAYDQAALLRAGRFDALDLEHLIEEVEDLAGSLKSAVRSRATLAMADLLQLQHSPAQNPRLGVARDHTHAAHPSSERPYAEPAAPPRRSAARALRTRAARRRGLAARPRRAGRRRRAARDLPLHARSDHRGLAAVNRPCALAARYEICPPKTSSSAVKCGFRMVASAGAEE
jgi:hypothetical protein